MLSILLALGLAQAQDIRAAQVLPPGSIQNIRAELPGAQIIDVENPEEQDDPYEVDVYAGGLRYEFIVNHDGTVTRFWRDDEENEGMMTMPDIVRERALNRYPRARIYGAEWDDGHWDVDMVLNGDAFTLSVAGPPPS